MQLAHGLLLVLVPNAYFAVCKYLSVSAQLPGVEMQRSSIDSYLKCTPQHRSGYPDKQNGYSGLTEQSQLVIGLKRNVHSFVTVVRQSCDLHLNQSDDLWGRAPSMCNTGSCSDCSDSYFLYLSEHFVLAATCFWKTWLFDSNSLF